LENPRFPCHLREGEGIGDTFIRRKIPAHQKLADADREDVEQSFGREADFGEVAIAIGERAGGIEAFAFGNPLEVAALTPVGEVDLGNGRAIEL